MHPDAIDRVVRKYAGELGLNRGYSAHSMRATFITSAITPSAFLSGKLGDGLSGGGSGIRTLGPSAYGELRYRTKSL
jgi:hypothetical protein